MLTCLVMSRVFSCDVGEFGDAFGLGLAGCGDFSNPLLSSRKAYTSFAATDDEFLDGGLIQHSTLVRRHWFPATQRL